jgi:protein gp37
MGDTKIEWTDRTWNPVRGCSRVSPGCDHCYAMGQAHRFDTVSEKSPYHGLTTIRRGKVDWTGVARFIPEQLGAPLRWRKPQRIFVNSMSDLFHESLSNEEIAAVFGVMAGCPQHTFQVLTKRPKRATEWFKWIATEEHQDGGPGAATVCGIQAANYGASVDYLGLRDAWPLPNVHLGVSAEDQETYNARVPVLVHQCPAALHWVSLEPQLGPIKLRGTGHLHLGWVVQGGESGPGARPFDVAWAHSMLDECAESGIPYFMKQLGAKAIDSTLRDVFGYGYVHYTGTPDDPRVIEAQKRHDYRVVPHDVSRLLARDRRKGGDTSEWPEALRVRQFPETR